MGDCGSYDASMSIEYSLKKKEKNTENECNKFIADKGFTITSTVEASEQEIDSLYESKTKFTLNYKDWESWDSENMSLDEMQEALEEYNYSEEDGYSITVYRKATVKDIEDMCCISADLKTQTDALLGIGEYIYCENDNTSYDSKTVKSLQKYLSLPEARLILVGDGNGNC